MKHFIAFTFYCSVIRSDEELKLKTSTLETIYGGQFTLSTQLITVRYHVIPHRRSTIALFFRNYPPLHKNEPCLVLVSPNKGTKKT